MAAITNARQSLNPLLQKIGRRAHIDHLCAARITDGTRAAHEKDRAFINVFGRIINPLVKVLWSVKNDGPPLKSVHIFWVRKICFAEIFANHAGFHDRTVKQITAQIDEARIRKDWLVS